MRIKSEDLIDTVNNLSTDIKRSIASLIFHLQEIEKLEPRYGFGGFYPKEIPRPMTRTTLSLFSGRIEKDGLSVSLQNQAFPRKVYLQTSALGNFAKAWDSITHLRVAAYIGQTTFDCLKGQWAIRIADLISNDFGFKIHRVLVDGAIYRDDPLEAI